MNIQVASEVLKVIIFLFISILSLYHIGNIFEPKNQVGKIAIGFVVFLGANELLGFWLVATKQPKIYLVAEILAIYAILIILGFKKNGWKINVGEIINGRAIVALVTIILIFIVLVLYRSDADDSFYVSNATLFQNTNILNQYDSSFGNKSVGTVPMYDFQIWESVIAIMSNFFHLEAVSMMHTYILPVLLVASASAYVFLGEIIFEGDKKKTSIFYILLTVFHLYGGYAVFSEGSFLLSRLWQGKAVYLTIVLPIMIGIIMQSLKDEKKFFWLELLVCILAGMSLNPTSLYVMGFQLLFMMITVAIVKKEKKFLLHIVPAVLSVALFSSFIYIRTSQYSGQIEASSVTNPTFVVDTFTSFWGSGIGYVFYM